MHGEDIEVIRPAVIQPSGTMTIVNQTWHPYSSSDGKKTPLQSFQYQVKMKTNTRPTARPKPESSAVQRSTVTKYCHVKDFDLVNTMGAIFPSSI
ncbi:hypothetical protein M378DRAFT_854798 [Amanita muscaria Koide BX008]|uniref:Uncharacterized protein n=1 Tax=Amanita muscaria (strain Koide BX008) TaxID=946122 RepID=A0A0C2T4F5_AMAMK|nr:hypothetical protein M378DRAFT_854798 [Amanita muscaria Koide BX008]